MKDNISKHYRAASDDLCSDINMEAKTLAENLKLDDRMDVLAKKMMPM